MGFASKIAAAQNNQTQNPQGQGQNMSNNQGTYGGAPPAGYTGGPPAALRPGGYPQQQQPQQPQYQAYAGSPPPNQGSLNQISPTMPLPRLRHPIPGHLRSNLHPTPHPLSRAAMHVLPRRRLQANLTDLRDRRTLDSNPNTRDSNHSSQRSRLPIYATNNSPLILDSNLLTLDNSKPILDNSKPILDNSKPIPDNSHLILDSNSPILDNSLPMYISAPMYLALRCAFNQGSYPPQGAPYPGGQGRPGPSSGPPGQYGAPGGGPPQQAAPPTQQQVAAYRQLLIATIQEKNIQSFYPPERLDRLVQSLASNAPAKLQNLIHEWNVPMEVATDVMKLALFDVILYVDDSGSIEFEEKGLRKDQLRQILGIVATAAATFDEDGISVRFMNSSEQGDGIRSANDVNALVSRVRFSGLTPLGTSLKSKVIDPMIVGPARAGRLEKPVLVITITDGQPAGEPHSSVNDAIRHAVDETSRTRYGRGAVSFQFSQVGNDQRAREFLGDLDEDPQIGSLIDCTSNFEVEQDEMSRANPPVHLTRELWCAKLMLGAIDSSYDTKDEKASGRAGGGPPPQASYGGYNQQPSGGQPGYGAPPPGYQSGPPQNFHNPQPGYGQAPPQQQQQQQQQQQPPYSGANRGSPYGQPQPYGYPSAGGAGGYPPPPRRY
ncbi:uncharacterized protein N7503_008334 [Penicillium pulvis]|uniref:uncharacterized protein n=1 Tax=Penicillium pulvis TaxID=1562058 RepID=UPI00254995D5|nr:uncharacterized protein N7503_008334 [Penicillium pulvis]KAJ5792356.1 hypothetical protein N7503_008334 [Penicillium pulvis]